jgi:hypothetical protein
LIVQAEVAARAIGQVFSVVVSSQGSHPAIGSFLCPQTHEPPLRTPYRTQARSDVDELSDDRRRRIGSHEFVIGTPCAAS